MKKISLTILVLTLTMSPFAFVYAQDPAVEIERPDLEILENIPEEVVLSGVAKVFIFLQNSGLIAIDFITSIFQGEVEGPDFEEEHYIYEDLDIEIDTSGFSIYNLFSGIFGGTIFNSSSTDSTDSE